MSRDPKEFEIAKLLQLADKEKYAMTVAAFEVIDKLEQIEIPKRYINRKPAVKAMIALSDGIVQYDYIADEARQALLEELHGPGATAAPTAEIAAARGKVPVVDESEEDLGDEDVGEIEPTAKLDEDVEEGEESEAEEEEEEEEEDEDSDDDDDDEEEEEPEDD